jgi:hypothetical protein
MIAMTSIHSSPAIPNSKPSTTNVIDDSFALLLPYVRNPNDERYFVWWKRTKHDVRTVLNRAGRALRRYKN